MTAPDKIWTAPTDGKCHVGFDTKSMNYTIEYTSTDLVQAAVAAAYEAAAEMCFAPEAAHIAWDMGQGNFPKRSARHEFIAAMIRALATPDQITALAAKVDASQAPNPAVNGGRCQSDTIPLPRAEVVALMESAQLVSDWDEWALQIGGVCPDRLVGCLGKMRLSLATLQERMK